MSHMITQPTCTCQEYGITFHHQSGPTLHLHYEHSFHEGAFFFVIGCNVTARSNENMPFVVHDKCVMYM